MSNSSYLDKAFLFDANKYREQSVSFFRAYDVKIVACKTSSGYGE